MSALSSWSPGKKPISLVDTKERTRYIFSYGVDSSRMSEIALYKEMNVFPVPAVPYATRCFPSEYESKSFF